MYEHVSQTAHAFVTQLAGKRPNCPEHFSTPAIHPSWKSWSTKTLSPTHRASSASTPGMCSFITTCLKCINQRSLLEIQIPFMISIDTRMVENNVFYMYPAKSNVTLASIMHEFLREATKLCELWGGVSKFWCVNLKKVLF